MVVTVLGSKELFRRGEIVTCRNKPYKAKNNLLAGERAALDTLKSDKQINFKKADKGTNKEDKINEGQIVLFFFLTAESFEIFDDILPDWTNAEIGKSLAEAVDKFQKQEEKFLCRK